MAPSRKFKFDHSWLWRHPVVKRRQLYLFSLLSPQSSDPVEMEEEQPQSNTQHPPQEEAARGGEQPSPQAPLQTSTVAKGSPPSTDQDKSPINTQEQSPQSQNKLLWKPIPPLVPETHSKTRDQSCQTEESSTSSHGQNTGGKNFPPPCVPVVVIYPPPLPGRPSSALRVIQI